MKYKHVNKGILSRCSAVAYINIVILTQNTKNLDDI